MTIPPPRLTGAWLLAGAALLSGLSSCFSDSEPTSGQPHVLVISLDTTRRDRLSFSGDALARTPRLHELAAQSVVFTQASTVAPITLPSHTSLFTGLYPAAHGVHDNIQYRVPVAASTMAERLGEAGYRTGAVVAAMVLRGSTGIDQGFERFDDAIRGYEQGGDMAQRNATAVTDSALKMLEDLDPAEGPVLMWAHYFDPHKPYAPPLAFGEAWLEAAKSDPALAALSRAELLYRAELEYLDHEVGRLLDGVQALDPERPWTVVVVADHGEALGEHGEATHGTFVYEDTLAVPMMIRADGVQPGQVDAPVSIVDLLPTVLDLVGLEASGLQGRSQGGRLRDPASRSEQDGRALLFETQMQFHAFGWAWLDGVRRGPHKLIESTRDELYDLSADPSEFVDLARTQPEVLARLSADLDRLRQESAEIALELLGGGDASSLDPELIARLESLGYTAALREMPSSKQGLPEPRDFTHLAEVRDQGSNLLARGDFTGAMRAFRRLLEENPEPTLGTMMIATCYSNQAGALVGAGRAPEATESFRRAAIWWSRAVQLDPERALFHYNLALAHRGVGLMEGFVQELGECLRIDPRHRAAHWQLGRHFESVGEDDLAREHLSAYLSILYDHDTPEAQEVKSLLRKLSGSSAG